MLYMMYRLEISYPKMWKWLQRLFEYFNDELVRSFSLLFFKNFKNKIKMMRHYNNKLQTYLANGDYVSEDGFTHIPCPVCTSRHCIHFNTEYLDTDFRDNTCQANDLRIYWWIWGLRYIKDSNVWHWIQSHQVRKYEICLTSSFETLKLTNIIWIAWRGKEGV